MVLSKHGVFYARNFHCLNPTIIWIFFNYFKSVFEVFKKNFWEELNSSVINFKAWIFRNLVVIKLYDLTMSLFIILVVQFRDTLNTGKQFLPKYCQENLIYWFSQSQGNIWTIHKYSFVLYNPQNQSFCEHRIVRAL